MALLDRPEDIVGDVVGTHAAQVIELHEGLLFDHVLGKVGLRQAGTDDDDIDAVLG